MARRAVKGGGEREGEETKRTLLAEKRWLEKGSVKMEVSTSSVRHMFVFLFSLLVGLLWNCSAPTPDPIDELIRLAMPTDNAHSDRLPWVKRQAD